MYLYRNCGNCKFIKCDNFSYSSECKLSKHDIKRDVGYDVEYDNINHAIETCNLKHWKPYILLRFRMFFARTINVIEM